MTVLVRLFCFELPYFPFIVAAPLVIFFSVDQYKHLKTTRLSLQQS